MIKKEIIDLISSKAGIKRRDLIEKDLILHKLLLELSVIKSFYENYAFKGGTCLTKCYLGYYRFSQDLDFTYINQDEFLGKSGKKVSELCSKKTNEIILIFKEISGKNGLDFSGNKKDTYYVEFGRSNRQVTLKIYYNSSESKQKEFIKIQINFEEKMFYSAKNKYADSIFFGKYEKFEMAFLLPEDSEWILKIPKIKCYDIKEILLEKVRAILTRKALKPRDFIDVFFILDKNKLNIEDYKKNIINKTKAMMKYENYIENLKKFDIEKFVFEEEKNLMLEPLDKNKFDKFMKNFKTFIIELQNELNKE